MQIINLRSDTQTLPTAAMLEAMREAQLGDETYGEDPTVRKLEAMSAERFGKEAALLVVSGTMGNLVSLMAHTRPGDEVVLDSESHIFYYEGGGLANVAGLMPMPVPSRRGLMAADDLRASIRGKDVHFPAPRLLCLENTHNRGGGTVTPLPLHRELCRVARDHGLSIHLDGARIFNAALAAGVSVREYAETVDSVMFCLTKGLSCPLGSVVVGSSEFIAHANRARRRLGGGMRQAGIIAAAGIVALEQMVDRLVEDHAHARLLADGIAHIRGLRVDVQAVETNMVYVDHTPSGLDTEEILRRFLRKGIVAEGRPPGHIRFVTNRHHDPRTVAEALQRIWLAMEQTPETCVLNDLARND